MNIANRIEKLENHEEAKNTKCIFTIRPYGVHVPTEDEVEAAKGRVTFIIGKGYVDDKRGEK